MERRQAVTRQEAGTAERLHLLPSEAKWIAENIAEDLEAPEGSSIPAHKAPFSDDELNRIYAACDALGGPKPPGPGYREWGGEDVKDFVLFSIYTGLRISDAATFDITRGLNGNDVFLRMHKTKKELYTWVPDWLVARLRSREQKHGPLIFRYGTKTDMRSMAEVWRTKLAKVFERAGSFDEKPTPHRLRHTFVRIMLENGVPIADVAESVGDTERIVRRHYAKWVPSRQARLSNILRDAFSNTACPVSNHALGTKKHTTPKSFAQASNKSFDSMSLMTRGL